MRHDRSADVAPDLLQHPASISSLLKRGRGAGVLLRYTEIQKRVMIFLEEAQ